MALVLVLAALALLSFLVVLVLTMTRNEDRAAKSSADIIEVRTLAGLPEQIVISQIRRATSNLGAGFTWASQPGMIRLFASGGTDTTGRAALYEAYRLYSSPRMVVLGSEFNATTEPASYQGWSSSTALFTDLNEPIPLRPVVKSGETATPSQDEPRLVYPILDPGAMKLVEGFDLAGGAAPGASATHPLPMPAMWLYVLRDGRVIAPKGGEGATASFETGTATESNPIVGRIAFWTDDESCKVNLNTAGEPAPWDEPRANSKVDRAYAAFQPAQSEFHRQSGHPAFTALSPVFQSFGRKDATSNAVENAFTPVPDPAGITTTGTFEANTAADAEKFRDYVESNLRPLPRSVDHRDDLNLDRGSRHGTKPPAEKVRLKNERLFSTIDELLFDTERRPMKVSGDGLTLAQTLNEDDIRRARFFLTTHSAAPETNPFNGPKISLWPVQESESLRTRTDRRMTLAATLAGNAYYWQRAKEWSGNGSPGSSQSTGEDVSIRRNLELIGYLQDIATLPVPGYGGSLSEKLGGSPSNSDQIITAMFDLLRWGVNVENADAKAGEVFHYLPPGRLGGGGAETEGGYSAVPMILSSADNTQMRGFGRFPTITEVALVFVATEAEKKDDKYVDEDGDGLADKTSKLRMFVILEPFCPVPGVPAATPAVRYRIRGLDQVKISGKPLFAANYPDTNRCVSMGPEGMRMVEGATGFNGLASQFLKPDGTPKKAGGDENDGFPFLSQEITLDEAVEVKKQIAFTAADTLTVEILPAFGATDADAVIQTLRIPLPERCDIPVPGLDLNHPSVDVPARFAIREKRQPLIQHGDVVRSVEADPSLPWRGDLRLLALMGTRGNAPVSFDGDPQAAGDPGRCVFPSPVRLAERFAMTDASKRALHSLRSGAYTDEQFSTAAAGDPRQRTEDTSGRLLAGFPYPPLFAPAVVSMPRESGSVFPGAINVDGRPGDWNNGPGLIEDGPYVAKPDNNNTPNEVEASGSAKATGGWFQRGGDFLPDEEGINSAPHRQMASAVAFGSLPTGVHPRGGDTSAGKDPRPWQTLLFCPNPASRQTEAGQEIKPEDHFGFMSPPDHMWLEFFWMPVTEPWLMSPGCSTAGKVNLNTQIMPYSYIQRTTAMHAALRGVRITAIPAAAAASSAGDAFYKNPARVTSQEFRYPVNAKATLQGMDQERFQKGDVFRSASEICEMFLVPKRFGESDAGTDSGSDHDYGNAKATAGLAHNKMIEWWNGKPGDQQDAFEATGDNTREAPYAQLYPRLCTRSNVFQVHYRVQLVRKSRSVKPDEIDLAKDTITAEYRGSTIIERYIDPNDREIPDAATQAAGTMSLDDHYKYRIVSRQPFTP